MPKFNTCCLTMFLAVFFIPITNHAQKTTRIATEKKISGIGMSQMFNSTYTISSNLHRVAFRMRSGNKLLAVIDSLKGKAYDDVSSPIFSPNDKHFAYAARNGSKWLLNVDNKEKVFLDSGSAIVTVLFSPDSKKLVYLVKKARKSFLVVNDVADPPFDAIDENSIRFTPDSRTVIYTAQLDKKQYVVINGKKGTPYDQVGFPILSQDGKRMAYWVVDSNHTFVILDNKKSKPYESVGSITFSKDGKHLLYDVTNDGKQQFVLDGKESEKYESLKSVTISPDASRVAFQLKLSPGNEHGFMEYAVVDDKKEGPYEQLMSESFVFSPDGKEITYCAQLPLDETPNATIEQTGEWFIVRNGKVGKRYDILPGTQMFSPNGLRLAYTCESNSKRMVNVDDTESPTYHDVLTMLFSPDSKRIAYSVKLDNQELVVVDGKNGKAYDSILGQGEIIFDSPDSFHYLAMKGNNIYLVKERFE